VSVNLGNFGRLDFGDWLYGLFAAIIGGGATVVASAFGLVMIDPSHFNLQSPQFYKAIGTMFLASGIVNGFMFLRTKPLPDKVKTTVFTSEKTDTSVPKVKEVMTVRETTVESVPPEK
jgi:hypothetical protein